MVFVGNDGGSDVTALTLDMSDGGTATFNSHVRLGDSKTLSLGAGFDIEITSDGSNGTIATPNGILLLDSSSSIRLDADSGEIDLRDGGTDFGQFAKSSNDFRINHSIQDGRFVFRGNDGGNIISALTLDIANAGAATFNSALTIPGDLTVDTSTLKVDSTNNRVGIGTPSPDFKLHVSGANTSIGIESTTTNQNASLYYKAHGASQWETGVNITAGLDYDIYDRVNNASRMIIDHSGNVGIGVTPSASHYETLELGTVGSGITGRGAADTHFLSGLYWDGASTRKYAVSGVAVGTYQITNGAHYWSSPAAGTAGNLSLIHI